MAEKDKWEVVKTAIAVGGLLGGLYLFIKYILPVIKPPVAPPPTPTEKIELESISVS